MTHTPRVLEPQCAWTAADVADESSWTELLGADEQAELAPGDLQFINNYHVLHGRTPYTDDRARGQVRHLKRSWLETEVLADRPPRFRHHRTHWESKRTASRMTTT